MHADHLPALVEERRGNPVDSDEGIDQRIVVHPGLSHCNGGEHSTVCSDPEDRIIRPHVRGSDAAFNFDPLAIQGSGEQLRQRHFWGIRRQAGLTDRMHL
jgi:hypothetical protein